MPKARARARELGVDISVVEGTGRGGAITAEDVERAAASVAGPSDGGAQDTGPKIRERRLLRGAARTMAEVVSRSWLEVPQFVQMVELDASALLKRRREEAEGIKETYGVNLSYTDVFLEALVSAVEEEPLANSSLRDDEVVIYEDVNVSVAVAAETGLLVPVIHRAQRLSLGDLAVRFRELASKAREGRLSSEDVEGGTITLSNLGMHGVEGGTPLVTSPQAAVAFFGAIVEKPWVVEGRLEVRPVMALSVGYDHRILDGATAARFTTALRRRLEGT
jgi:pyruvate dehydrogenase E2 component (dihydrolipoamide acetyltransferase)